MELWNIIILLQGLGLVQADAWDSLKLAIKTNIKQCIPVKTTWHRIMRSGIYLYNVEPPLLLGST